MRYRCHPSKHQSLKNPYGMEGVKERTQNILRFLSKKNISAFYFSFSIGPYILLYARTGQRYGIILVEVSRTQNVIFFNIRQGAPTTNKRGGANGEIEDGATKTDSWSSLMHHACFDLFVSVGVTIPTIARGEKQLIVVFIVYDRQNRTILPAPNILTLNKKNFQ